MNVSKTYAKDMGILAGIALLVLHLWLEEKTLLYYALATLLLAIVWPNFFKPLSWLWWSGSRLLGSWMSKVILLIVFFGLLTPLAWLVRRFRPDPLRLRQFKKSRSSVFSGRDHEFRSSDLQNPY